MKLAGVLGVAREIERALEHDADAMRKAGLQVSEGDLRCLVAGHIARVSINRLAPIWEASRTLAQRMNLAEEHLKSITEQIQFGALSSKILAIAEEQRKQDVASV